MPEPTDHSSSRSIPDHVAQQVLTRAIQLESDWTARMPIERLREIAEEAGISADALHRALMEVSSGAEQEAGITTPPAGYLRRLGRRLKGGPTAVARNHEPDPWTLRGASEVVATNVLAFFAFWVPTLFVLVGLRRMGFLQSHVPDLAAILLATLGGIVLARRIRANLTFAFLSLCAVGITANIFVEAFGGAQPLGFFGSTAFGLLVAGAVGIGFGFILGRQSTFTSRSPGSTGTLSDSPGDASDTARRGPAVEPNESPFHLLRLHAMSLADVGGSADR